MTVKAFSARRFRTILDCSLVLLLILMALSNQPAIQAKFGSQPVPRDAYVSEPASSSSWQAAEKAPADTDLPAELAPQDDNTSGGDDRRRKRRPYRAVSPFHLPAGGDPLKLDLPFAAGRGAASSRTWPRRIPAAAGPIRQVCPGFVAALQKVQQRRLGVGCRADILIKQDELPQILIEIGLLRTDGRRLDPVRGGRGIGVEGRLQQAAAARPETGAAQLEGRIVIWRGLAALDLCAPRSASPPGRSCRARNAPGCTSPQNAPGTA